MSSSSPIGQWTGDCPHCGVKGKAHLVTQSGPNKKAVCVDCGRYIKHVSARAITKPSATAAESNQGPVSRLSLEQEVALNVGSNWIAQCEDPNDKTIDFAIELGRKFAARFLQSTN